MNDHILFINELLSKRKRWVDANRENKFEEGIYRLLADLYPDKAHFIFELLQNAEDAGATIVKFDLKKDRLIVSHDGKRLFNYKDVESITSIGGSTKKDDINQIGKFGIGFKAVFSYTETPQIYSGRFSFQIKDLVCPYPIDNILDNSWETRFVFPFDHKEKIKEKAFKETAHSLKNLKDNVLLFLSNIETVEWKIEGEGNGYVSRLAYNQNHVEIEHKDFTGNRSNSNWLRFISPYKEDSRLFVAVAFKMDFKEDKKGIKYRQYDDKKSLSEQMVITPAHGQVSIFFPAEKETSNLKFHVHGPFSSTIDRASIADTEDNESLLNTIAQLVAQSLYEIKDIGLLTTDFLAVLPTDEDDLNSFYKPIQNLIIDEMSNNDLVPTHNKGYAPANSLYNGPAIFRNVITDKDLQFLTGEGSNIQWVAGTMQNTRQEKFLDTLGIEEWGWEKIIDRLYFKFSYGYFDTNNDSWLEEHDEIWLHKFYILLKEAQERTKDTYRLKQCKIVRLESGEHVIGEKAYFPDDSNDESFQKVHPDILRGKQENVDKASQFLESIGVKKVDEEEHIKLILQKYYSEDTTVSPSQKENLSHMRRFVKYWENNKDSSGMFSSYMIFIDDSGEHLRYPKELYFDLPYFETGLSNYYRILRGTDFAKFAVWKEYKRLGNDEFDYFAVKAGVEDEIKIVKTTIPEDHPDKAKLKRDWGSSWSSYHIDEDYTIEGIRDALNANNLEIDYLIWKCILEADKITTKARYRGNYHKNIVTAPSTLAYILRNTSWIPDKNGRFYRPCEMSIEDLDEDFLELYDQDNEWVRAIVFGSNEKKETEEYKGIKEYFSKCGTKECFIDLIEKIGKFPEEIQRKIYETIDTVAEQAEFPEKQAPNRDRRDPKIIAIVREAPNKERVKRDRTIRISSIEVKQSVRTYLKDCYTNQDKKMVCQICEKEMSFKLDNGEYYFEAVECIKSIPKELDHNYLALCPVCAAKYMHANSSKDEELVEAIKKTSTLTIPVKLTREDKTIRFVRLHLDDLRVILKNQ